MTTSPQNVIDFDAEQTRRCEQADEIIGLAIQLRAKLRNAGHLPLPMAEADALCGAVVNFVGAARTFKR